MAQKKATKTAKKAAKPAKKAAAKKAAPAKKPSAKTMPKKKPVAAKKASAAKKISKPIVKIKSKSTNNIVKKMPPKTTSAKPASKPTKPAAAAKPAAKPARTPRKAGRVIIPANYKPTDKEEYMSNEQLEYFRQKLIKWKDELSAELTETLDNLKEENWQESDIADRATVETDASLELRTRDRYRKLINKINEALFRIDKGEYGYCQETGEEIGLKRLEARPIATLSIEAQERHERDERTHYDEDLEERLA